MRGAKSGVHLGSCFAALIILAILAASTWERSSGGATKRSDAANPQRLRATFAQFPLSFIPNRGQLDKRVQFYSWSGSASFFFAKDEVVYTFIHQEKEASLQKVSQLIPDEDSGRRRKRKSQGHVVRLRFVGANSNPVIEGQQELPGKVSYFISHDPARWKRGLLTYGQVCYRELWPGIDLIYRGQGGGLKYEFVVRPGADPRRIRLAYRGIEGLALSEAGDLILQTASEELRDSRPVAYQEIRGRRVEVEASFRLLPAGPEGFIHGFKVRDYDPAYPLILDPELEYSTFLGGSVGDSGLGIALDGAGNAYVTGYTRSPNLNFPITPGAFDTSYNGGDDGDAFVAKLSADGSTLFYATFLGGSRGEQGSGIAVDAAGNAYVTGWTYSPNFPATAGAFDSSFNGGYYYGDAFVAKLSSDGSALLYATFLGGSDSDKGSGIALDGVGDAYVTGQTASSDFPTTAGAFDPTPNGDGPFVAKLSTDGSTLLYATLLGGSTWDSGFGIAVDAAGNAYVAGYTLSSDFPTTPGAFDPSYNGNSEAFVTRIAPSVQFAAATYRVLEGGGSVTITVRSDGIAGEVTVDFAASDGTATAGSDYAPTSGTLTFSDGETSKSFTIPVLGDVLAEGDEIVILTLSNATGGATLGAQSTAVLTITEPGFLQFSSDTFSVSENADSVTITLIRKGGSGGEVTVGFATSDGTATAGSDYTHTSGTLIFADGETSKSFTVPILNNALMEGDKTVNLTLSSPTGGAILGSPSAAVLTVTDNDVNMLDYFPATPGDTWTYLKNGSLTVTTKVLPETVLVNGVETKVFQNSDNGSKDFYTIDADGIRLHREFMPKVWIEGLGRVNLTLTSIPPMQLADRVMEIGQTVSSNGIIRTNRLPRVGVVEIPYSASFTVQGIDKVTVPAGDFDVVRVQGTITASDLSSSLIFDLAKKIGIVKWTETALGATETLELTATNVGAHDLAITKITAPKKITLKAGGPPKTALVKVELQNRSPHDETIQGLAMLDDLVTLAVESWRPGSLCSPAPTPVLRSGSPQKPFLLTLKPKQKLTVAFDVTFACANDPLASTARDPNHWDYSYTARVDHAALGRETDTYPADDICPHSITPPFEIDANPDGTIQDKGCGEKQTDGTLGADVLTDVVVKVGKPFNPPSTGVVISKGGKGNVNFKKAR